MIQLDNYIFTMKSFSGFISKVIDDKRFSRGIDKKIEKNVFRVFWGGLNDPAAKSIVMETGFFWNAAHIDTMGLYHQSSLSTPEALRQITSFSAPVSAQSIILTSKNESKFSQGEDPEIQGKDIGQHDVILACQNPTDRSIRSVASPDDYYKFIDDACSFYGKKLFIKLHPWNSGAVGDRIRKIASAHGIEAHKINHRVLDGCQFVLVFNSTFSVDCMLRGVPVAQYAPGYFWQNPAVMYTKRSFPTNVRTDEAFGYKTCDFLAWRYCFDFTMDYDKWVRMLFTFARSNDLFPMPADLSYAANNMSERSKYEYIYSDDKRHYGKRDHGYNAHDIILSMKPVSLLDVGCGKGAFVEWAKAQGISAQGIDIASGYGTKGDICNMPFEDNSFDVLTAFDVLEHLRPNDLDRALNEMLRVTRKAWILSIGYGAAKIKLLDSTIDLHPISRDQDWWIKRLKEFVDGIEFSKDGLYLECYLSK